MCLEVKALPNIGGSSQPQTYCHNVGPANPLYFENRGGFGLNSISDWPRDPRSNGRLSSPCLDHLHSKFEVFSWRASTFGVLLYATVRYITHAYDRDVRRYCVRARGTLTDGPVGFSSLAQLEHSQPNSRVVLDARTRRP